MIIRNRLLMVALMCVTTSFIALTNAFKPTSTKIGLPKTFLGGIKIDGNAELEGLKEKVLQREQKKREIVGIKNKLPLFTESTERVFGRLAMVVFSIMLYNEAVYGEMFAQQFENFESYGVFALVMSFLSYLLSPK